MNAREVKDAIRRRHPGGVNGSMPGAWTVIEEFAGIDVLAFSAWSRPPGSPTGGPAYPIVGYEVKVSRSDYRRELLRPGKRALSVASCDAFYFAVPAGLLSKDEKAYEEPEHFDGQAFRREPCPARCQKPHRYERQEVGHKAGRYVEVPTVWGDTACRLNRHLRQHDPDGVYSPAAERYKPRRRRWQVCETCEGRGYLRQSVVEQEAPTLWTPADVGLVEVNGSGCRVVRKAPINDAPKRNWKLVDLVRWVSMRPDPRHHQPAQLEAVAA